MDKRKTTESHETFETGWKNFQFLNESEIKLVNENRYEAFFKPGEIIIKQGTPAGNALFLISGMAKNYIEGIRGRNFIMSILLPGILILGPELMSIQDIPTRLLPYPL